MERIYFKNILMFKLIERSREERKTYKANRVRLYRLGGAAEADRMVPFQIITQENIN